MEVNLSTAKPQVLLAKERLSALLSASNSEKDQDHRNRYKMASYLWSPDAKSLLFDTSGRLWLFNLKAGAGVEIGFTGAGSGDDPKFSPDGKFISYLKNHNLFVIRPEDPRIPTIQLTRSKDEFVLNGEVDWAYQEELSVRSNYFWAPDSKKIAYLQVDEDKVPQYPILDWIPAHASGDIQRYPLPGDPNPKVRVGIVGTNGSKTIWANVPISAGNDYIPAFGWMNARTLWIEVLTRDHKHRNIYFADAETGSAKLALEESAEKFFDEGYDIFPLDHQLLLTSWRDGHTHVYSYSFDPKNPLSSALTLEKQVTTGDYEVKGIKAVDESRQMIYYSSNEGDPLQQHLWQIQFDGTHKKQISTGEGWHEADFSPTGHYFVDTYSSRLTPPRVSICKSEQSCNTFWDSSSLASYKFKAPEILEIPAEDGTKLYASLLLPESSATASVPLIVNPYGGPHSQTVKNQWGSTGFFFDQLLAQHGYAVLHLDNRGMGGRGRDFAYAAYHNFGPVQFQDQMKGVDTVLARYPQLDKKRLGWWGWSWGGTFTLYALSHSDRFAAGVSVAPVTDWHKYDSIYTERYMSRPADFPEGYKDFSVATTAKGLKGRLLLVHGTGDDNVHLGNSIGYIQNLIDANIPFDLQLYPRKTHSIAGKESRTHLYERILWHFDHYLMHPETESK